jgi:choline kinase
MQALILAAGMGTRLGKYTEKIPKCMIEISNISLIERVAESLIAAGIERLVVVVGYKSSVLSTFIKDRLDKFHVDIIDNPLYATTNNIYTLYLARKEMIDDDTILLEADLIFANDLISSLCHDIYPNMAVIDNYDPKWMSGTVVEIDQAKSVTSFIPKKEIDIEKTTDYYKTVNIYKFSREFSKELLIPELCHEVERGQLNEYYETVLGKITKNLGPCLTGFLMEGRKWFEIDDENDYNIARKLFTE